MFGFFAGALALVLLMKLSFGGYHYRRGWRHGGWHGHHRWHGGPGGWRRMALYSLFERLDATPGQEKVIASTLDELREKMKKIRETWSEQRHQAASVLRSDVVTPEQAEGVFAPFSSHFDELRAAAAESMRKIHEALDERQRAVLADLVERGWMGGRC
jgi:hypothetical protein